MPRMKNVMKFINRRIYERFYYTNKFENKNQQNV